MATTCNNVLDDLLEYQEIQVQIENGGTVICMDSPGGKLYLCACARLWTPFPARAFVFQHNWDAAAFVDMHPELNNVQIEVRTI